MSCCASLAAPVHFPPPGGKGMLAADELHAFKLVGAALLVGYTEIYDALEMAARLVFTRACEAGQQFVAHR